MDSTGAVGADRLTGEPSSRTISRPQTGSASATNGAEGLHPPPRFCLSGRQRQVLCLAARGLRDGEIAIRLQLSRSTVRQHLCKVHQHLNARNTTHAVVIALRLKILSLDEVSDARD